MASLLTVVAIICLIGPSRSQTTTTTPFSGTYRTAEDNKVSAMADKRANDACGNIDEVLENIDREEGRQDLVEGVGDRNFILEALEESNNEEELADNLQKAVGIGWAVSTAGSLLTAIMCYFLWFLLCYTACPCRFFNRCCRCECLCAKERKLPLCVNLMIVLLFLALTVCMVTLAYLAFIGKDMVEEGMDSLDCTAARVLNYTLNGYASKNFTGMLPLLDWFGNFKNDILLDTSPFITSVFAIADDTVEIEKATFVADKTLQLLKDTLALTQNLQPVVQASAETTTADTNIHKCTLCEQLGASNGPISSLQTNLANGVATALKNARSEVRTQLGPTQLKTMRDSFDASVAPMREVSTLVRDSFKIFLDDGFQDLRAAGIYYAGWGVLSVSVIVWIVLICAWSAGCLQVVKGGRDEAAASSGKNPWTKTVYPCAGAAWCGGFCYTTFVLLLGGIMIIFAVPMCSICLIMEDIDSQLIKDIMPALGSPMNTSDPDFDMVANMVDMCFSKETNFPSNQTLMDILKITENGQTVSMRQKIKANSTDPIKAQFATVTAKLSGGQTIMGTPEMNTLLAYFDQTANPIQAYIVSVPSSNGLPSNTEYNPMGLDTSTNGLRETGMESGTSLSCDDFTTSGATIKGVDALKTALETQTSSGVTNSVPASTCTKNVVCNNCGTICAACEAGNDFMNLKAYLTETTQYRCDIFQVGGADCDIKDMSCTGGTCTNDCSVTSGSTTTMTVKAKTCTLSEFATYMGDWDTRLTKAFTRVDDAVAANSNKISVNMNNLVNDEIVAPIEKMCDDVNCGFLKKQYEDMILGMCYKGALGFRIIARSYAWNGILALMMSVLAYALWRISIDNRNLANDRIKGKGLSSVVPVEDISANQSPGVNMPGK